MEQKTSNEHEPPITAEEQFMMTVKSEFRDFFSWKNALEYVELLWETYESSLTGEDADLMSPQDNASKAFFIRRLSFFLIKMEEIDSLEFETQEPIIYSEN